MMPLIGPLPPGIAELVDLLFGILIIAIIVAIIVLLIKYFTGSRQTLFSSSTSPLQTGSRLEEEKLEKIMEELIKEIRMLREDIDELRRELRE